MIVTRWLSLRRKREGHFENDIVKPTRARKCNFRIMQTWRQNECEKRNRLGNNKEIRNQTIEEKKSKQQQKNHTQKTTLPFLCI